MLISLLLVSHFNFLFIPCGRLSWLPLSFLLYVKYTLSYRIVSYKRSSSVNKKLCYRQQIARMQVQKRNSILAVSNKLHRCLLPQSVVAPSGERLRGKGRYGQFGGETA